MKKLFLLNFFLCIFTLGFSQGVNDNNKSEANWKLTGNYGVNFSQIYLSNWATGGENSISLNSFGNIYANYKKDKSIWENSLELAYGTQQQNQTWKKTSDKIHLNSKYSYKLHKSLYYSALFDFKTQMTAGYDYLDDDNKSYISDIFSPAYFVLALGINYKPDNYFSAMIAPATGKMTLVCDSSLYNKGDFGVDPGDKTYTEFGGYLTLNYKKDDFKSELLKNIAFNTEASFFSNYLQDPQNIDINWEIMLAMKVNKYLTVNVNTNLVYDNDIKFEETNSDGSITKTTKLQFKELFGLGLMVKF